MIRKTIIGAALAVSTIAAAAGGASAQTPIVFLAKKANVYKVVTSASGRAGEWIVSADLTVVNWGGFDTISCRLWMNPRESAGQTGWHVYDNDSVSVGGGLDNDGSIHLEATVDSTRRFNARVECLHSTVGERPYVEPGGVAFHSANP